MKSVLCTLCLLTLYVASGQYIEKDLKSIETINQAEAYLESEQNKANKIVLFNAEKHNSSLAKELISKGVGTTKIVENEFGKTYFKVINKTKEPFFRLNYILLDGNEMSVKGIESIRKIVLKQHETKLETFANLARKYSVATNKYQGGDTSWVTLNELPEALANIDLLLSYKIGEIYTLNLPDTNQFYIIKKTYNAKEIEEVKVLKIETRK